jgi:predicted nucleic acid-binding protein
MRRIERVACDAGPIIALINRRDQFHSPCLDAAKDLAFPLFTVWPVIVEAYYILDSRGGPADRVIHWLTARHLRLVELRDAELRRMEQLSRKYSGLPMDLADAALIAACERMKIHRIFTVDRRDFLVYRPSHVSQFEVIP